MFGQKPRKEPPVVVMTAGRPPWGMNSRSLGLVSAPRGLDLVELVRGREKVRSEGARSSLGRLHLVGLVDEHHYSRLDVAVAHDVDVGRCRHGDCDSASARRCRPLQRPRRRARREPPVRDNAPRPWRGRTCTRRGRLWLWWLSLRGSSRSVGLGLSPIDRGTVAYVGQRLQQIPCIRWFRSRSVLVGDTGFEPVTSSVSGKRATAAPIARRYSVVAGLEVGTGFEPV